MKTAVPINRSAHGQRYGFAEDAAFAVGAEHLGVDAVCSSESWAADAFTPLGHLAALTKRVTLLTGIAQVPARSAAMTAMTAMTLDGLSGGRLALGLGVSSPRIAESVHGRRFIEPLVELRDYVEVVRLALGGRRLAHSGSRHAVPLPGAEGRPMQLNWQPHPRIPIYLGTIGPTAMHLCGEVADGWIGICFVPEQAGVYLDPLSAGARLTGRDLSDIDIVVGGPLAFTDDVEPHVIRYRQALAFMVSALGTRTVNFYRNAFWRLGYGEAVEQVRAAWFARDRNKAAETVPDEIVFGTSMIGTEAEVRDRIRAYRDAGVTTLLLEPWGSSVADRLDTLAGAVDLVRQVAAETPPDDGPNS